MLFTQYNPLRMKRCQWHCLQSLYIAKLPLIPQNTALIGVVTQQGKINLYVIFDKVVYKQKFNSFFFSFIFISWRLITILQWLLSYIVMNQPWIYMIFFLKSCQYSYTLLGYKQFTLETTAVKFCKFVELKIFRDILFRKEQSRLYSIP